MKFSKYESLTPAQTLFAGLCTRALTEGELTYFREAGRNWLIGRNWPPKIDFFGTKIFACGAKKDPKNFRLRRAFRPNRAFLPLKNFRLRRVFRPSRAYIHPKFSACGGLSPLVNAFILEEKVGVQGYASSNSSKSGRNWLSCLNFERRNWPQFPPLKGGGN